MQINKSSWHYKFWKLTLIDSVPPTTTNLCRYVQRIFWCGLLILLTASLILFLSSYVVYAIFYLGFWQHTLISFEVLGVFVAIVAAVLLFFKWRSSTSHQEPGLVGQWVRAKKERVCPLITFTDEQSQS